MNEVFIKTEEFEVLKKHFKRLDLVSIDELCSLIEELNFVNELLEEKVERLEETLSDIKFNPYKEYGLNERDFY